MMENIKMSDCAEQLFSRFVVANAHRQSDYFSLIKTIIPCAKKHGNDCGSPLRAAYALLEREILENRHSPTKEISFGTSGWRGVLGKDINIYTVSCVTAAIVDMFQQIDVNRQLARLLLVDSFAEAQERGCVLGFDNRFGGEILARAVAGVLLAAGFRVHYAGESTTGVLSAAVLQLGASCSINLTPSHNPLEYGGYKFNGADAGPAASGVTEYITKKSRLIVEDGRDVSLLTEETFLADDRVHLLDSLQLWKDLVSQNRDKHGLDLSEISAKLLQRDDISVAVDSVHGASRLHIDALLGEEAGAKIKQLRNTADVTFGGVAPEPSSANMQGLVTYLQGIETPLKLGAIIDPDGDRIRFTDGDREISMNQFGAIAYHFLHEEKGVHGLLAKTVASSNLANRIAESFSEEIFEPRVGFKEFKPVVGRAVVCFEESDGISIIGHTPEKDAYIGLLLALDIVLTTGENLGTYLGKIEACYGSYYPEVGSVAVSMEGLALAEALEKLSSLLPGQTLEVAGEEREISQVIDIDGRKIIFADASWLMIRPSGTEPKVRFYVESRTRSGASALIKTARQLLIDIGLLSL
ncbi:phosphohexomutase domain-containing protein [Desulfotalea psychrophila]|uniref:Related to phosphoglucomutase/phosphomannomutase n=1 Tax=Desulfotalea psychrophila (strain LSv54 / DSM 12343) TaxID=177439 RepID=Q6AL15_DESPS|nr:phosphoglucomutase [Desulfotalea psychrophila]CAG36960.1 related to phosphoglucomutase/phosphomannomutase [Desulfotalea psychrophila LSv54]